MNRFQRFEDIDTSGEQPLPRPPASVTVTVWDLGPQLTAPVPKAPEHTATPAAWADYETDVARHIAAVLKFRREKAEFDQKYDGPVRLALDPTSAREFLARDSRYVTEPPPGLMHSRPGRA
jgi:hypothetical protein